MKNIKIIINRMLDVLLDNDKLKYLVMFTSPLTYLTLMFLIVIFPLLWIWEQGLENIVFYLFKYQKLDDKSKKRILDIWQEKDFNGGFNKFIWGLTVKRIKKDLLIT